MLGEVPNCLRSVVVSILLLNQEGSSIKLEKQLGSAFHIHCMACLLPLIGKENLSVRNFPLSPKTKWITLENLMQLNVFLEHEHANCRLVSQHRMIHIHHKVNESYHLANINTNKSIYAYAHK